jgi:hypothetical protein
MTSGTIAPSVFGVATGLIVGFAASFATSDGLSMPVVGPSDAHAAAAAAVLSVVAAAMAIGLARLLLPPAERRLSVRGAVASLLALLVANVLHEVGVQWVDLSILGGGPWGDLVAVVWPVSLCLSLGGALGPIARSREAADVGLAPDSGPVDEQP